MIGIIKMEVIELPLYLQWILWTVETQYSAGAQFSDNKKGAIYDQPFRKKTTYYLTNQNSEQCRILQFFCIK